MLKNICFATLIIGLILASFACQSPGETSIQLVEADRLLKLGQSFAAAQQYELARLEAQKNGDRDLEAKARLGLGQSTHETEPLKIVAQFSLALDYFEDKKDLGAQAQIYFLMGQRLEEFIQPLCIEFFNEALHLFRQIRNTQGEARARLHLGKLFYEKGEVRQALRHLEKAASLRFSSSQLAFKIHFELGRINGGIGRANEAVSSFQKALTHHKKLVTPRRQKALEYYWESPQKVAEFLEKNMENIADWLQEEMPSAPLNAQRNDAAGESDSKLTKRRKEWANKQPFNMTLKRRDVLVKKWAKTNLRNHLARAVPEVLLEEAGEVLKLGQMFSVDDYSQILKDQARALRKDPNHPLLESFILLMEQRSESWETLQLKVYKDPQFPALSQQAMEQFQMSKLNGWDFSSEEAAVIQEFVAQHIDTALTDLGEHVFEQNQKAVLALNCLGHDAKSRGQKAKAERYFKRAWRIFLKTYSKPMYRLIGREFIEDAQRLGLPAPVPEWYPMDMEKNTKLSQIALRDPIWEADYLMAKGQLQPANTLLSQFLPTVHEPHKKFKILWKLAKLNLLLGEQTAASTYYHQAVAVLEETQQTVFDEDLIALLQNQQAGFYGEAIAFLVQGKNPEQAFALGERARARALSLNLAGRDLEIDAAPKVFGEVQILKRELAQLVKKQNLLLSKEPSRHLWLSNEQSNFAQQIGETRLALQNALAELSYKRPDLADLISGNGIEARVVRAYLPDADTALVSFFGLEDQTLVWVIDKNGQHLTVLPIGRLHLEESVNKLRLSITRNLFDPMLASQLYEKLWAPLPKNRLKTNLILVPHGALHYLPFNALWNSEEKQFLVQEHRLSFAPSAAVLKLFGKRNRKQKASGILALGNPETHGRLPKLPYAAEEARFVAGLFGVRPFLGPSAREGLVHAQGNKFRILHLAAHGILDQQLPMESHLALAAGKGMVAEGPADYFPNGGKLKVGEIFSLNLSQVELAFLSACDTSLGELSQGDELVALNRAFMQAGVTGVVSTLWSIEDKRSATLVKKFYRYLLMEKHSPASALRQSQLDMIAELPGKQVAAKMIRRGLQFSSGGRQKNYLDASPYLWAGFIYNGPVPKNAR